MKAAAASVGQLADRVERLRRLGLPLILELHLAGDERPGPGQPFSDGAGYLRSLGGQEPLQLVVHVPYQQPEVVTRRPFDRTQVLRTIELAGLLDADGIVLHRYYGLTGTGRRNAISKADAEASFNDEIRRLSRDLGSCRGYVENLGFFWLRPRQAGRYLAGPLDHFFPWEVERFTRFLAAERVGTIRPMVDLAHATQSANMFTLLRRHLATFREDPRFDGITDADLAEQDALTPYDFLRVDPPYVHISDAFGMDNDSGIDPDQQTVAKAITGEGLPLGSGTLDVRRIVAGLARSAEPSPIVVAEVDPAPGQSHLRNAAQEAAIRLLLEREGYLDPAR